MAHSLGGRHLIIESDSRAVYQRVDLEIKEGGGNGEIRVSYLIAKLVSFHSFGERSTNDLNLSVRVISNDLDEGRQRGIGVAVQNEADGH